MKIELRYFTGTGNSLKVLTCCREVFIRNNHSVNIRPIKVGHHLPEDADIIGFCFPVYAFGIPRICRKYLKQLRGFSKLQRVFILITAGNKDESGFSVRECVKILRRKNCRIMYTDVVEMPVNWITYMNPPSKEEAVKIIEKAMEQIQMLCQNILKGVIRYHPFNIPGRYGRFGLYKEYYLFRYLGVKNMWRCFDLYDTCNGCGLCAKICPTGSIKMVNQRPVWTSTCEQCMRCVNFCPKESIYQTMGGYTSGRNRYHEPDFEPLKEVVLF
jgi:Pyruvate/2-oxoacid:ferredoxin oxidoreductase delta subunit